MTEKSEWQFLVDYVKDDTTDFYNDACQNQLVALWTSYCLHKQPRCRYSDVRCSFDGFVQRSLR